MHNTYQLWKATFTSSTSPGGLPTTATTMTIVDLLLGALYHGITRLKKNHVTAGEFEQVSLLNSETESMLN